MGIVFKPQLLRRADPRNSEAQRGRSDGRVLMTKRRGNNEGTIYRTTDNRWRGELSLGPERRPLVLSSRKGESRRDFTARWEEAKDKARKGLPTSGTDTLGGFLAAWLESRKPQIARSTVANLDNAIRMHIAPCIGKVRLSKLTPAHIQHLMNTLAANDLAPGTRRTILATCVRALDLALRWGQVHRNAARLVDRIKPGPKIGKTLSPAQRALYLVKLHEYEEGKWELLFRMYVEMGFRRGELLGLRWCDVDLPGQSITPAQQLTQYGTSTALKTATSRNPMPIPTAILGLLTAAHKAAGAAFRPDQLVFSAGHPSTVLRRFQLFLAWAGLPKMRLHDMRHTAASHLLISGTNIYDVQGLLGHASIQTTVDTYGHHIPGEQTALRERMDALEKKGQ